MAVDDHARAPVRPRSPPRCCGNSTASRARALGERLARGTRRRRRRTPRTSGCATLNWLYRRVQRLQDEAMPSAALTAELRAHRARPAGTRAAAAAGRAGPAAARRVGDDDFDVAALQDSLSEGDALVEYGVLDDELFACVVTRAGVVLQRHVAPWPAVLEALRSARFQIETLRHGAAPVRATSPSLTARAQQRMRPVARAGVGAAGSAAGAMPRGCWWCRTPNSARCPSPRCTTASVRSAQRYRAGRGAQRPRGVARPAAASPCARAQALVLGESTRLAARGRRSPLRRGSLPAGQRLRRRRRPRSTRCARTRGGADVIHLACHAQFRSDNPMFSALHLADGALTVERPRRWACGPASSC